MIDIELKAMSDIFLVLEKLEADSRIRVLKWAADKFGASKEQKSATLALYQEKAIQSPNTYKNFADLYNAAQPRSNGDKALAAGYWLQICQELAEFPSQLANKELQNLGYYIPNITDAFTQLKNKKPALAIQVKKSGKSQQARKQYKLTQAGIDTVKNMLGEKNDV